MEHVLVRSEVAIREPQRVQMSADQLRYIGNTEFVPKGLRGNLPAIMACVATGRALGIDDMSSLRLIHVVNGRPTFSAELMVQIVRRHGHSISGVTKDGSCTVTGKRADNGDTMEVTWTLEMAKRAGLADKATWKAYPEALLWARAVSQLCRQLFADCFAGSTHTPEELGAPDFDGDYVEEPDSAGEPQALETSQEDSVSDAPAGTGEQPSPADEPQGWKDDDEQKRYLKKLNVLVGTLREAGHITTEQLWKSMRPEQTDAWPGDWPRDEGGELHWSPLRDSLTKDEAHALIERLAALEERVTANA